MVAILQRTGIYLLLITALLSCSGSGNTDNADNAITYPNLSVYPKNPVVPVSGSLDLSVVLEKSAGLVVANSESNEQFVTYRSLNTNVATIDSNGRVSGLLQGAAQIAVELVDSASMTYNSIITINVQVSTVDQIFLNPNVIALTNESVKKVYITATKDDSPVTVEADKTSFEHITGQVSISENINANSTAYIEITGKQTAGYTFVTPKYSDAGVIITGAPVLIQFTDSPQPPANAYASGKDLSFDLVNSSGKDYLFVAHTNNSSAGNNLYLTTFNPISGGYGSQNTSIDSNLAIHQPIIDAKDLNNVFVTTLVQKTNTSYSLYSSKYRGLDGWSHSEVASNTYSYNQDYKAFDIQSYGGNSVAIVKKADSSVTLLEITPQGVVTTLLQFSDGNITNIDLAVNLSKDNIDSIRFIYKNANGINYITREVVGASNTYKKEVIPNSTSWVNPILAYSRKHTPYIVAYSGNILKIGKKVTIDGEWSESNIDRQVFVTNGFTNFAFNNPKFSFDIDYFGSLRILMVQNNKIYHLKQFIQSNGAVWRIDEVVATASNAPDRVLDYVSTKIDDAGRIKAFYQAQNGTTAGIRYWAEPTFFQYRDRTDTRTGDDTIRGTGVLTDNR